MATIVDLVRGECVRLRTELAAAERALAAIQPNQPKVAPAKAAAKTKRVVSEATKAKMRAAHAARKAAKVNGSAEPATTLDAE